MLNIISLGAGVQSSTMALMAAHGEITPMPDCAIFADTGAEPRKVYEWLVWLEKQLPFPVHRVSDGNLRDDMMNTQVSRIDNPPLFTFPDGLLWRKCTGHYKIAPIKRKVRELTGGSPCVQWIGISADEASRMKPSGVQYITHRWPLIEENMTRSDCLDWMEELGYPSPSKSACTFCPYHDNATWRDMRDNDPDSWRDAVKVDATIRNAKWGTTTQLFLHRDRVPLADVDLRTAEDMGQQRLFDDECEGMCGV